MPPALRPSSMKAMLSSKWHRISSSSSSSISTHLYTKSCWPAQQRQPAHVVRPDKLERVDEGGGGPPLSPERLKGEGKARGGGERKKACEAHRNGSGEGGVHVAKIE